MHMCNYILSHKSLLHIYSGSLHILNAATSQCLINVSATSGSYLSQWGQCLKHYVLTQHLGQQLVHYARCLIDGLNNDWCFQEGDLDSAIKKYKGYLPEDDIMLKFVQIALALHYTHSKVHNYSTTCFLCSVLLFWDWLLSYTCIVALLLSLMLAAGH